MDGSLRCDANHHFDRAKEGYWNLTQPQDKRSLNPGDCDAAVLARQRWLQRGHAAGLVETIMPWIEQHQGAQPGNPGTLDLGCGEGTFGPALFPNDADTYCGIDLSRRAIKLASRRWPAATWVLANADRTLPVADGVVDRVVSLFGRRPTQEIARVMAPDGVCMVALPADDDLIELRDVVQESGTRRSRWEQVVDEMAVAGLKCTDHKTWREQVELPPDAIADALAMTYRAVRHSQQSRLDSIDKVVTTLSADLMLFSRSAEVHS